MPIRLLPPDVASRIAAGEVIERPASVVKELIENSLDAGATEVAIEVRGAGVEYIRVVDNGCGIPADEVELAFQRFATSKVASITDLESISTLGFRGEALPSIAAVSSVTVVTRARGEDFGTRVDVAEGAVVRKERQGAPQGTAVTVRHLFRDFPARRKFLRSPATETSRIQAVACRYALAYPEVRFQLTVDGSTAFASTGSADLREVVAAVYDPETARAMLEITPDVAESSGPRVWGLVSPPRLDRANRGHVTFFVNRRYVQNRSLGFALEQAYQGFLMERRYPIAVVSIGIPPEEIDVNVHPSKAEVRFRREGLVFSTLQQAVRRTLTAHSPVPEVSRVQPSTGRPAQQQGKASLWPTVDFDTHAPEHGPATGAAMAGHHGESPVKAEDTGTRPTDAPLPSKVLPVLRVVGQVQNTYIVAEAPDGMYLIDQHAAHERVVFEKVRADAVARTANAQSLLEPVTVELDTRLHELLEAQREAIARTGFDVEHFGGRTYLLRAVPSLLAGQDPRQAFLDVLDSLADGGGYESWEERAAYSIACHGAIRAGKSLTYQEMTELTRLLEQCQQPHTCPHGRPTMVHLSAGHLEREFGRR